MTVSAIEQTMEVWELTIPGRVSVTVAGELGRPRDITARGEGQRIRLTTHQRRICEEQIREAINNPFRNGMMIKINRAQLDDEARAAAAALEQDYVPHPADQPSDDELTNEELANAFGLSVDENTFGPFVESLSEVNVRRLLALAAVNDAKASQVSWLNDYIRDTYSIGGTTPTWEEMQQTPRSAV